MADRSPSSNDRGRRALLGGVAAAALLGVLSSAIRSLSGGPAMTSGDPPSASRPAPSARTAGSTPSLPAAPTTTAPPATDVSATTVSSAPGDAISSTVLVIEKAGWGAAPERAGFVEHEISGIVVHHTAVALGSNADAPGRIRGHQRYHQEQGWPDIAYHMLIDGNGNIYEGRPLWARGDTFTDYDPAGYFLPALEGDFNADTPSAAQLESLAALCAWAADRWDIHPAAILSHRDIASTTCPGANLHPHVADGDLASRVRTLMESGPELDYLRGQAALDLVAEIEAVG